MDNKTPILQVKDLQVHFPILQGITKKRVGEVHAVDNISFTLDRNTTLGLVGESGCGKTTTGKAILRMVKATNGEVYFNGKNLLQMSPAEHSQEKRKIQMVFQDPYGSLDPRQTAFSIIREVLVEDKKPRTREEVTNEVNHLLRLVELSEDIGRRYPHEMSGGQRQRVGIARALACNPDLIICDEPVSALDVSIQAQIVNLLKQLQREIGLTYLFIAHDLAVVRHIADRVAVMYLGRIVELMDSSEMYKNPIHPYTQALLNAIPVVDYELEKGRSRALPEGEIPSPINIPSGCTFHPRCPYATEECKRTCPELRDFGNDHLVACHHPETAKENKQ